MPMNTDDQLTPISVMTINSGNLAHDIDAAIERAMKDVIARKHLKGPRCVTVKIQFAPVIDHHTGENWPRIDYQVGTAVPGAKGPTTTAVISSDGVVLVNIYEMNARQTMIDYSDAEAVSNEE